MRDIVQPSTVDCGRPAIPVAYGVYHGGADAAGEMPWVRVSHYLEVFKRHRWKMLLFVSICMAATALISKHLTPVYESTAMIDIDRRMPAGILGQEATQYPTADADQFLATQINLIQSDSVLRPVVERFKLPVNLPSGDSAAQTFASAADAPIELKDLRVSRVPNTYLLLIRYRSHDPQLAAGVANDIANSYILHSYTIRYQSSVSLSKFMEAQLEELKTKMEKSGAALAKFERELNVINPEEKTTISSARLLQLNTEYTTAQADRMRKEAEFNSVKGGAMEAAQFSTQGQTLKNLTERLDQARESFAQVKAHYGANHPEYRRVSAQIAQLQAELDSSRAAIVRGGEIAYNQAVDREEMLKKAVAQIKAELDALNARSFEYQTVKRGAEADKKLYEELTTKIKEAGINAGFQNSAIRLADPARPAVKPVFPRLALNLLLCFLFSSLVSIGAVFLADALDQSVRDPKQASRMLNMDVIGLLPTVKPWRRLGGPAQMHVRPSLEACQRAALVRISSDASGTGFDDAIRTLRNTILLGNADRPLKSLLIVSAFPREGKTTVATHLAIAHAQQKHRTLLVDGDMRRPGVCHAMGLKEDAGFSKALRNGMHWREEISYLQGMPELHVLGAGPDSADTADLVGSGLAHVLKEAKDDYDLVIVDAPPLLGFPEPLQMAAAADGVVVIALAGQTDREALESLLGALQRIRANVVGLVLNDARHATGKAYNSYGYSAKYQC
jgi:succinoglycan biosynthesis transport protein ExoP